MKRINATLSRWSAEDKLVDQASYWRNLQVLNIVSWGMVALNLAHVCVFALVRFDNAVQTSWAHQIAAAHGAMALLMIAVGGLNRLAQAPPFSYGRWRLLPEYVSALVVAWAVVLTAIDQAIGGSIYAYLNASVGVSIVFLLRPRSALAILGLGWCALVVTLSVTISDAALLMTSCANAASATFLAMLVSVLLWRRYAQAELLQRALTDTNRQLELQRVELEKQAMRDPLTGFLNRREFLHQAEQELKRAQRQSIELSVLMLDLDHFKAINDQFGHPVGDEALRQVALLMKHSVRETDRVARFGGEEFVVLLPDTSEANALQIANKLRQKLADTAVADLSDPVTVSIGLACKPANSALTLDALIQCADQALYQAKHEGRNRTVVAKTPTERPRAETPSRTDVRSVSH